MTIRVIKYGSSVLRSSEHVDAVADDILSQRGAGDFLIVVVSAFEGRTTRLIEEARMFRLSEDSPEFAGHVCVGEYETAAALLVALTARRIEAFVATPARLGFVARGPRLDADPVKIDPDAVAALFDATPVVIAPGYCAIDDVGQPVLLGRGGSDLSAVFMAAQLGAGAARLVKDVDAVYDRDPKVHADATRLREIDYAEALKIAGKLIQPKALDCASRHNLRVEIAALGLPPGTVISGGV